MKKKGIIIAIILLMTIGFAAVSTTLIINGNAKVNENTDDFSVIFTKATLDGIDVYSSVVDDTKKTITFRSKDLKKLNDTSILTYKVANNSSNYDAEVKINCNTKENTTAKYTSIKNELENNATVVKAKQKANGTLTITLNQTSTEEINEEYTCTLEFNAVERDELGKKINITKTGTNIGDEICIESECFYIYGYENTNVKLLAKYNLYVGGEYDTSYIDYGNKMTYIQDSTMKGLSSNKPYRGVTQYSNINHKGETYNSYEGSIAQSFINEYMKVLNGFGLSLTNDTIRLITQNELVELGCSTSSQTCTISKYSWLYNTSYWTMTPSPSNAHDMWAVYYNGNFSNGLGATGNNGFGIRPVVIISKDLIN